MAPSSILDPQPGVLYRITTNGRTVYAEYSKDASIPAYNSELGQPLAFRRRDLPTHNYFTLYQDKRGTLYNDKSREVGINEATPEEIKQLRYHPSL